MNAVARKLRQKIEKREARIGVVGMGYVGLPLAVEFARAGFPVVGIDVDRQRVARLRAGRSHVEDVPSSEVAALVRAGTLEARSSYRGCGACDVLIICVPTPRCRRSRASAGADSW
jgi:UDP-N-acetyl-D-glucosamine dehydrogenase